MGNRILIIDDEIDICQLLCSFLEKKGYSCDYSISGNKGLAQLKKSDYDLVLLDFRLPDMSGNEALKNIKAFDNSLKVIIITGYSDVKTAVDCIKLGASEYVTKPIHPEEILHSVKSALVEKKTKASNEQGNAEQRKKKEFVIGKSKAAKKLLQLVNVLAPTNMSVVIQGESGTGKEMVANLLHDKSKRFKNDFVAIDCGALPKELAASELFGHIKGSFTGAINDKVGHFESANGGTLFLDEIGNLSYENQVKLLRVLQERKIKKIGDTKTIDVDVRIIAASNENLETLVEKGEFREDLFYRLNEFMVDLAPLRERDKDILLFSDYFLNLSNQELERSIESFDDEAKLLLANYSWPGNLRELRNVIRRAVLLCQGNSIGIKDLPDEINEDGGLIHEDDKEEVIGDLKSVAERAERKAILRVLAHTNYNKTQTAKILQIDRKTLYNKMDQYQIEFKKTYG